MNLHLKAMSSLLTAKKTRWSLLLAVVLLLAACGKDEVVAPSSTTTVRAKNLPGGQVLDGSGTQNGVDAPDPKSGNDGVGDDISDDGDDVGDGERKKKKKRPS
jgi:hypothetical protein